MSQIGVRDFKNKEVGSVALVAPIFEVPLRSEILTRVVHWQLAKRRAGTHKTKGISEISGSTRKPFRQKGTGNARLGSKRAPQCRGGATIFGPQVRSHAIKLPKKVRSLGLRMALSMKVASKDLLVIERFSECPKKTKDFLVCLQEMGLNSVLFVGNKISCDALGRVGKCIPRVDVLAQEGLNVYSILHRKTLVLERETVAYLEARFQ